MNWGQLALRAIIGVLGFYLFMLVLPLLFGALGLPLPSDAIQLIRICAAIVALVYIIWGPPIPRPNA